MAKSAFEEYPRETAVRLIAVMGGTGVVLVIAGFVGEITTFWAAGSILLLFAVASWPKQAEATPPPADRPKPEAQEPTSRSGLEEEQELDESDPIFESAKAQLELLREEVARRRKQDTEQTRRRSGPS